MCQLCGCQEFIKKEKGAVLERVIKIVKELSLTPANVDTYEATETISDIIAPLCSREEEVYQTAAWIAKLHEDMPRSGREEKCQAHVQAFRDIFSHLPAQGDPKLIATTWHQLEQLARELDEVALASLDPTTRETIQAVNHVHDDMKAKRARLKEHYSL